VRNYLRDLARFACDVQWSARTDDILPDSDTGPPLQKIWRRLMDHREETRERDTFGQLID
jgi:hypothetical protein